MRDMTIPLFDVQRNKPSPNSPLVLACAASYPFGQPLHSRRCELFDVDHLDSLHALRNV
jgi:hypothetical protein